jgi:putative FmdB family regulatory protein
MPIYEYQCASCAHAFEKMVKLGGDNPPCPECGKEVRKRVSAAAFVLKGGGWYRDHYGLKKSASPAGEGGSSGEGASSSSAKEGSATSAPAAPATPAATTTSGS